MLEFGNKNEFITKIDLRIIEFYLFFPKKDNDEPSAFLKHFRIVLPT